MEVLTESDPVPGRTAAAVSRPQTSLAGFVAVVAGATTTSLPIYLVGTAAVQMRGNLRFSVAELGIVVACFNASSALMARPAGGLAERIGGSRTLRSASVLSALTLALIASTATSWPELAAILAVSGAAASMAAMGSNLFLARRVDQSRRGLAFGIKQSSGPMAFMLSAALIPTVALTVGWRWAFAVAASLALVAGAAIPRPRTSLRAQLAKRSTAGREPLGPLALLALGHGLALAACASLTAFLVSCCVYVGLSPPLAGVIAVIVSIAGVTARILVGYVADRRRRHHHFRTVSAMVAVGAIGFVMLGLGSVVMAPWLVVIGAVVAGGIGWGWNGLFNFAIVQSHLIAPARATSVTRTGARTGSILGPLLFGVLTAGLGYDAAWYAAAAEALLGALVIVFGGRLVQGRIGSSVEAAPVPV